jgi:hypothetical protein
MKQFLILFLFINSVNSMQKKALIKAEDFFKQYETKQYAGDQNIKSILENNKNIFVMPGIKSPSGGIGVTIFFEDLKNKNNVQYIEYVGFEKEILNSISKIVKNQDNSNSFGLHINYLDIFKKK